LIPPRSVFRLILDTPGNGQENMAVDEALLASVGGDNSPATVRLYGFAPAALSFGRFQRVKDRIDRDAVQRAGVTLVRRPTGGQAVLHDQELTYAVVLSKDHLEPFHKREIYRFIAELLLLGLARLGVRGRSSRNRIGDPHNPDCFRSTGEYEIASPSARKLIGSAQVVNRNASLQHGAIPLDTSYTQIGRYLALEKTEGHEEPGCLSEELGHSVSFEDTVRAFAEGFAIGLDRRGIRLQTGELTDSERQQAAELLKSKYSRDAWNLMY
jgi:lipoate-protein ligase A